MIRALSDERFWREAGIGLGDPILIKERSPWFAKQA
jgi:hypothetical protein